MRPVPFFIEIPDRPVYQPGSGPTMAPITLQPDDSDTGWVIDGTVEFQGLVQYVVAPADNPAHRRPVKKQHILDWVSAKAYEDFEYDQYKRQIDNEKDREIRILAKTATFREKKLGKGYAGDGRKARKPFAKYMQLEPVEDSDTGITSGHLSSPEHSSDELNSFDPSGSVQAVKRKRSMVIGQDNEPSVKRRGVSGTNTKSLLWKPWQPSIETPSPYLPAVSTEGREIIEMAAETTSIPDIEKTRIELVNRPTLPSAKQAATLFKARKGQERSASPFSAPSKFVPASASPLRLSPRINWSTVAPAVSGRTNRPRSASPLDLSNPQASTSSRLAQAPRYDRDYPPIQTPKVPSTLATSQANFESFGGTRNGTGEFLQFSSSRQEQTSKPPRNETFGINGQPRRRGGGQIAEPDVSNEEVWSKIKGLSYVTTGRGSHNLAKGGLLSRKLDVKPSSVSSGSSDDLRRRSHPTDSKSIREPSEHFKRIGTVPQDVNNVGDEMEVNSEESWEIGGILDDQLRRVDGILVRYYLCEWVGDYEPTWEPKGNISALALQKYEKKKLMDKKKKRSDTGFDGAADIMLDKEETSSSKLAPRLDNEVQNVGEESDTEEFMDALSDTAKF